MYGPGQFVCQCPVDQALTVQAALVFEYICDDFNREMALSAVGGAGVAGMQM